MVFEILEFIKKRAVLFAINLIYIVQVVVELEPLKHFLICNQFSHCIIFRQLF